MNDTCLPTQRSLTILATSLAVLTYNNRVLRATAGLKGDWKGWTYDTAFVAAHAWLNSTLHGFMNYPTLITRHRRRNV